MWGGGRLPITEDGLEHLNPELDLEINFEVAKLGWDPQDQCVCSSQIRLQGPQPSSPATGPLSALQPVDHVPGRSYSSFPGTEADAGTFVPVHPSVAFRAAGKIKGMFLGTGNLELLHMLQSLSVCPLRGMKLSMLRKKPPRGGC